MRPKSGRLSEKTKVAVSLGENPWRPRDRETSPSMSRTRPYDGPRMSLTLPPCVASWRRLRNSLAWPRSSLSLIFDPGRKAETCSRNHSSSRSASYDFRMRGMTASVAALTIVVSLVHGRPQPSAVRWQRSGVQQCCFDGLVDEAAEITDWWGVVASRGQHRKQVSCDVTHGSLEPFPGDGNSYG